MNRTARCVTQINPVHCRWDQSFHSYPPIHIFVLLCIITIMLFFYSRPVSKWARQRVRHNLRYRHRSHLSWGRLMDGWEHGGDERRSIMQTTSYQRDYQVESTFRSGDVFHMTASSLCRVCKVAWLASAPGIRCWLQLSILTWTSTLCQGREAALYSSQTKSQFTPQGAEVMPCPSRSPDLNIIENVWSSIGARVNEMDVTPDTADELWTAI